MSGLKRNEKFHVIIFFSVFVYFIVLKITNHIEVSWPIMIFPIVVGIILYYGIKYARRSYFTK